MTSKIENVGATSARTAGWLRLARVAALVVVACMVVLQISVGTLIPPILIIGLIFATLAPFLGGGRRWAGLVAAFLGVAAVGGNVPSLVEEITHPSSARAFILTLISASAAVVLIVAGAGAFFRWPLKTASLTWVWIGVVVAGTAFSLIAAAGVESEAMEPGDLEVVARANQFMPDRLTAPEGQVAVWLDNRDGARHTFTVPQLGLDIEIAGLKSQRVEFQAARGEYPVFCSVVGHENMTMTLVVD